LANTKKHSIVVTRGPLSREDAAKARRIKGGAAYVRMCNELGARGIGKHNVTLRELQYLTVSSHRADITTILYKLLRWKREGSPFFAVVDSHRYGTLQREAGDVQLHHLEDFDHTQYEKQPDVENTGDVLDRFLFEFKQVMKTRADIDWSPTGQVLSLAKRILSEAGGLDAALALLKAYVKMPPEHRGDDLSFRGFYANIPAILNMREATAREEYEQQRKMAALRERRKPMTKDEIEQMVAENLERARAERGELNG